MRTDRLGEERTMTDITLDRIKDAALYAGCVTLLTVFITAALWWHVPGKVVICMAALADVTLTFVIYAVLWTIEMVLINAIRIKKTTRRGYIARDVVRIIARCDR